MTTLSVVSVAFFIALVLFGVWIDGRRQKLLEAGKHPVTLPSGDVVAAESQRDP